MLISITIPTYNNASIVGKAIESAINQDYQEDYEVLIVNNASTDNTSEILDKYKDNPKVRIVTNPSTVELLENHNVCLREAKGDYVVFLHSDDELFENALTIISERLKMRHCPRRYILWGHSALTDFQVAIETGGQRINQVFGGEFAHRAFLHKGGLPPTGVCYSRESLLEIGAFPPAKSPLTPHDWYIMLWASFNFFEFEMMDRMILKRIASTTSKIATSMKQIDMVNIEMFGVLFEHLNSTQKSKFLNSVLQYGPLYLINLLKENYTKSQLLKAKLKNIKRRLFTV